ncbi:hypothetical protein [Pseudomonas segetis]|uniref:Uncharacterized protein n=1 Tax=Pseudomonas segetis TaxID=298908 RepID=A0A239D9W6_9PSED|nr:hypothetical protein [Pseudomonas segetis]SNS29057.1 hypothetical protein SAMN05216255_2147 [Pseudomonas segetis]
MFELALTILGVVLGFGLSAAYERAKGKRSTKNISAVLLREIRSNIESLKGELSIITQASAENMPSFIEPLGMQEIAERIKSALSTESFNMCRLEIPSLGSATAEAIFNFYESARELPRTIQEIERWAGNIRHGLFEDLISHLIEKAKIAENCVTF